MRGVGPAGWGSRQVAFGLCDEKFYEDMEVYLNCRNVFAEAFGLA